MNVNTTKLLSIPTKKALSHCLRSSIISVVWRVLHILLKMNNNLSTTSSNYLELAKIWGGIDQKSMQNIEEFSQEEKGIIISNHESWVFSDYLPLFAKLWEEIMKKSIFYTWAYNLSMNKREFPDYQFRSATLTKREDVIILKQQIVEDINNIKKNGGFIFIMPSWASTDSNAEFQSIFRRMVELIDGDTKILVNQVHHNSDLWYWWMIKSILTNSMRIQVEELKTTIKSEISSSEEWKWLNGQEMRNRYNSMFKK